MSAARGGRKREPERTPLSHRAHALLRREVVTGALPPGAVVTESGVCDRYRLTKAPARAALARLVAEGLVQALPRQGHVVAGVTADDVAEVYALRRVLEPWAVAQSVDRADLARLQRLDEACVAASGRRIRFLAANRAFHEALVAGAGNARLSALMTDLLDHSERAQHLGLRHRDNQPLPAWRGEVIAALARGDGRGAGRIVRSHLDSIRDMVLAALANQE